MIPVVVATVVLVAVAWRIHIALRTVERHIAALGEQLVASKHAQDHHHTELHRRLNGIEAAATRAEREARAVSDQLTAAMSVVS